MILGKPPDLIRTLVLAHTPVDEQESTCQQRILDLLSSAPDPFARNSFVPGHLTASAIVLDEPRENAVLIFHEKLKLWLQPGGHFEPGESDPSVAAAREVLEETGLKTRWPGDLPQLLDVDVHEIPARKTEPAHFHFDLRMLLIAENATMTAGEGTTDARWANSAEARSMNLDPGLVRALRKVGFK